MSKDLNEFGLDRKELQEQLDKAQKRNTLIMFTVIMCLIFTYFYSTWKAENDLDYIDGNVLKIARTGTASVGTSWKNASLIGQLTYGGVFKTDSTFVEVNPDLATGYTVSNDGLTYVISLRDDLYWSDGVPLTVQDLKWSIEAFMKVSNVNSTILSAFNYIQGAEAWVDGSADSISGLSISGNDLTIKLDSPFTSFALILTQFVVLPEHCLKDYDSADLLSSPFFFTVEENVTSGLYKMDVINENGDLELIKNEYYYGEESDIERIIMYGDYQNMNIDHYSTNNITEMVSYRAMPGFDEHEVNVYFYRYFVFNTIADYDLPEMVEQVDDNGNKVLDENGDPIMVESTEPGEYSENREINPYTSDVRVRQAINHAIDIETITRDVYLGSATLNYGGATDIAKEVYDYNPQKAIALLEEAEYDFDRPFTIGYYHTDSNTQTFLLKVKENLEAVGLTVRLVKTNGATALYELREYDMYLKALSAFNTEDWYGEYLSSNVNLNSIMGSTAFDGLMDELYSTTELNRYNSILKELVELEQELVYKIPMLVLNDAVYIYETRLSVPDDIVFGNTRYRSNLRFSEWYIKKG